MSTYSMEPPLVGHPPPVEAIDTDETDNEIENEDEVDQLDSDSEQEEGDEVNGMSASGKKARLGRVALRMPGTSLLSTQRLESILAADGVTGSLSMSKEAAFILSVATEEFVKRMAQAGHRHANAERRTLVNYRDMASTTHQYQEFMFLQDTIPFPVSLSEALRRREDKEKELLEEDPAGGGSSSLHATISGTGSSYTSKGKSKSRFTNGKDRLNGSAGASSNRKDSKRDPKGRWSNGGEANGEMSDTPRIEIISTGRPKRESRPPRRDLSPSTSSYASRPPKPTKNGVTSSPRGHSHPPIMDHYSGFTPGPPPPFPNGPIHDENAPRYYHPTTSYISPSEEWPGAYTGPASGFLAGTFNQVPSNPGRTIYSQRYDPDDRPPLPGDMPPHIQHYRPEHRAP